MISKNSLLMCILTVVMVAYLAFSLPVTADMARKDTLTGITVNVRDTLMTHFITPADIIRESGVDPDTLPRCRRSEFDLYSLKRRLEQSDKIQNVDVSMLSSGRILIDVTPMTPVARVFEKKNSYYINSQGKKISADIRYHLDVPVVVGYFDSIHPAQRLLPLLDHIARDPGLTALVSTVCQERDGNIIIVPTIVGHVVNFGDTSDVADKFARLRTFYRKVASERGWQAYDTVAVKWRGRVVGTLRRKKAPEVILPTVSEATGEFDFDDAETMTDPMTVAEGMAEKPKIAEPI